MDSIPQKPALSIDTVVSLASGVRLHHDKIRGGFVLLVPERTLILDKIGLAILERMDGQKPLGQIIQTLSDLYNAPKKDVQEDVMEFVSYLDDHLFLRRNT